MTAAARRQWAPVKYTSTQLGGGTNSQGVTFPGGLDLTTPALRLQPGALRDCLNFEVAPSGGYGRIEGYERFDGQAAPSDAAVTIVQIASFLAVPAIGQVITQAVTGATGTVAAVVTGPVPYLVLTKVTGAFDDRNMISKPTIGGALVNDAGEPIVNDAGDTISTP